MGGCRGGRVRTLILLGLAGCATASPEVPAAPGDPGDRGGETARSRTTALIGGCGPAPRGLRPKYALPYPEGSRYRMTQGNCGRASHGGRFSFSYDFEMPPGTPVVAARSGVVRTVRADRPDGTGRVGDENFVIIRHEDGEFSRYIHLRRAGALVRPGDRVARGDTIALSGHSGRSAFPHLHFDVSRDCDSGTCVTIPSAFLNAEPPIPTAHAPLLAEPAPSLTEPAPSRTGPATGTGRGGATGPDDRGR